MKKTLVVCFVISLLLLAPLAGRAQMKFGFKAYGGLNYLSGGDATEGTIGLGEFWDAFWTWAGANVDGEYAPAHLGMNFGGEFLLQFSPSMGIGLGVGYIQAAKSSLINVTWPGTSIDYEWKASLSAIPITASFYYFIPAGGMMNFYFNAGLGYYLAKANFNEVGVFGGSYEDDMKTSGGGLGFHGAIGLEMNLAPGFGLFFEARGRYAAFSNFEGTADWSGFEEDGILWAFTYTYAFGTFTMLTMDPDEPTWDDTREAKVDFSGFSFVIGGIIRF